MCSVEDFLQDIDPSLQYDIVPIYDPFGPTKEDPNFQVTGMCIGDWKCAYQSNPFFFFDSLPALIIQST
jgi:hypothetical protein